MGCQQMMDEYCSFLYSPDALGNLRIGKATDNYKVLQGETDNDFSQVYYRYAKAKIAFKDKLPPDLLKALNRSDYFANLKTLLARKPRRSMTLDERLDSERLEESLGAAWSAALDEAVLVRLSRKFPGVHQLSERQLPPEYEIEHRKIRRVLIAEISKAIWQDDSNWRTVVHTFERLREIYLSLIENLDVTPSLKKDWTERIQSVKLVLPGSAPEISDDECATTTINAYYYRYLNVITVCAGDFNSEDIVLTLAHEMAHALDISRSFYLQKVNSELGVAQKEIRDQVCNADESRVFSCKDWSDFKEKFDARLKIMSASRPEAPAFNRCLKRKPDTKTPIEEDVVRLAHSFTLNRYSNLANNGYFLRIIKRRMPLRNGRLNENPYYLDPCKYYLWSKGEETPEEELSSLVYFTAEYRCSDADDDDRFRKAIEVSRDLSERMVRAVIRLEGEFSSWEFLEHEGFASSPVERFADVLGSHATAEFLKSLPHLNDRRARFLSSTAWQCSEPSLTSRFPEESRIESEYIFSHHTEGLERRREILPEELREVLDCEKDFEFNECRLPFKSATGAPL